MRCPYCGEDGLPDTADEAWESHIEACQPVSLTSGLD